MNNKQKLAAMKGMNPTPTFIRHADSGPVKACYEFDRDPAYQLDEEKYQVTFSIEDKLVKVVRSGLIFDQAVNLAIMLNKAFELGGKLNALNRS